MLSASLGTSLGRLNFSVYLHAYSKDPDTLRLPDLPALAASLELTAQCLGLWAR